MIFQITVTIFLCIIFFMLYSSRQAYFMRIPVLLGIFFGIVCVWYSEAATHVAHFFGIGRAADLVFYICILLSFYCFFTLYIKMQAINENITKMVRKLAIDDALPPADHRDE